MDPSGSVQRGKAMEILEKKISEYNKGLSEDDEGNGVGVENFRYAAAQYKENPSLLGDYLKLVGIKEGTGLHLNCIEALTHENQKDSSTNQGAAPITINQPHQTKTLLTHGIPEIGVKMMGKGGSSQSRNHAGADLVSAEFGLIQDLEQFQKDKGSELYRDIANGKNMNYVNEQELSNIIIKVLDELVLDLNQQATLKLAPEKGFFKIRPDYWLLHLIWMCALGVFEIKLPPFPKDMSRLNGQMYDYLLKLSSFTGLYPVFGVITNYEEWIICWLGDKDSGESTILQQSNTEYNKEPPKKTGRVLYGKSYKREDKNLVSALFSVLLKMVNSRRYKLERFSTTRSYPVIKGGNWNWETGVSWKGEPSKTTMPDDKQAVYLVEDLEGETHGRVWLGCDKKKNHCVLKFFESSDAAEREVKLWSEFNKDVLTTLKLYVASSKLSSDERHYVKMPYVKTFSEAPSPAVIKKLKSLIEKIAKRGYCQRDMKWQHFGTIAGNLVALDFGLVERCPLSEARKTMNNWLDEQQGIGTQSPNTSAGSVNHSLDEDSSEESSVNSSFMSFDSSIDQQKDEDQIIPVFERMVWLQLNRLWKLKLKNHTKERINKRDLVQLLFEHYYKSTNNRKKILKEIKAMGVVNP